MIIVFKIIPKTTKMIWTMDKDRSTKKRSIWLLTKVSLVQVVFSGSKGPKVKLWLTFDIVKSRLVVLSIEIQLRYWCFSFFLVSLSLGCYLDNKTSCLCLLVGIQWNKLYQYWGASGSSQSRRCHWHLAGSSSRQYLSLLANIFINPKLMVSSDRI